MTISAADLNLALLTAAQKGCHEEVRKLCSQGVNVKALRRNDGATHVLLAAKHGRKQCIRLLHELGADVDEGDMTGYSPVIIAAMKGNEQCVRVLHAQIV